MNIFNREIIRKWKDKYDSMTKKERDEFIGFIIFFSLMLFWWIYIDFYTVYKNQYMIKKNQQVTKALITLFDDETRRGGADNSICYFFVNKTTEYIGRRHQSSFGKLRQDIVNKYAYVVYNGDDPDYNFLLLFKEDFETYNLPYPDSIFTIQK